MTKAPKNFAIQPKVTKPARTRRKTLAELNAWLNKNHDNVIKSARANCVQLTGKPTFGGNGQKRKSA